jgi:ABC-type phosphate transport system substrate-binding protein
MKTSRNLLAGAMLAAVLGLWNITPRAQGEPIAVIVHPSNPATTLSKLELRPLFQTTKTSWESSAGEVFPVNLAADSSLRQEFDRAVLGLTPDWVARYWQDRRVRGGERPPIQVTTTSAVLKVVAAREGAIGYVRASEVDATVKVVATITDGKFSGS